MIKIITVVGARPQFIKAAVVSHCLKKNNDFIEKIVHTGQHFDENMSSIFFEELKIPVPHYNLGVGGGGHASNTGRMMMGLEEILLREKPAWVLVYGDTDSTLAAALAASKLNIAIAHVEAGLRSFNMCMPEEINRRLTDHVSTLLLTPNNGGVKNLEAEGIRGGRVQNVGDVMYDASILYGEQASQYSKVLETLHIKSKEYVLATIHRKENTDCPIRLKNIFSGFASSVLPVVLPLHPRTRQKMAGFDIALPKNVVAIDPVGYLDMVMLEKSAAFIATDSGGVQKEAYFHGVPCLTLRDETEWTELVDLGWNTIATPSQELDSYFTRTYPMGLDGAKPYGNGRAGDVIVDALSNYEHDRT